MRYARQIAALFPGEHERLRQAQVVVGGSELPSKIAALYLAGAGVGRLEVAPSLVAELSALNSELAIHGVSALEAGPARAQVGEVTRSAEPAPPVMSGARLARWALARILSA